MEARLAKRESRKHHARPDGAIRSVDSRPVPGILAEPGGHVYLRYLDHAIFRNAEPSSVKLIEQEAWGILDYEDNDQVRLIVARYGQPSANGGEEVRATGLVIVKKAILEMKRLD